MSTVCGTGTGNFPQPGDPSTVVALAAQSVLGGILLTWTFPGTNPHAVAHFNIYRSTSADAGTRLFVAKAQGTSFMNYIGDPTSGTVYYYWIEVVSVNGTVGALNGPSSAQFLAAGDHFSTAVSGTLDMNEFSADIRARLDEISTFQGLLADETAARGIDVTNVLEALGINQSELADIDTLVASEIVTRTDQNSALVESVDLAYAKALDAEALVLTETNVRVSEDAALAQQITTLDSTVGDNYATLQIHADSIDGLSTSYVVKTNQNGHVAGFGLFNEAGTSEFVIAAEKFAIATFQGQHIPFAVSGGNVVFNGVVSFDNVTGNKPPADATRNVYQDEWALLSSYEVGDIVMVDGAGYICVLAHSSSSFRKPPNTTYWGPYTVKGADGLPGEDGAQGPEGPQGPTGSTGTHGAAAAKIFKRGTSVSAPGAGTAYPPSGWSLTVPSGTDPVWESTGNKPAGANYWSWDTPLVSAEHWTKPSTTLIDGNKIFTGDAYVDTLQIKGNAVTIAKGSTGTYNLTVPATYTTIGSVTIDWGANPPQKVLVFAKATAEQYNNNTTGGVQIALISSEESRRADGNTAAYQGITVNLSTGGEFSGHTGTVTYSVQVLTTIANSHKFMRWNIMAWGAKR